MEPIVNVWPANTFGPVISDFVYALLVAVSVLYLAYLLWRSFSCKLKASIVPRAAEDIEEGWATVMGRVEDITSTTSALGAPHFYLLLSDKQRVRVELEPSTTFFSSKELQGIKIDSAELMSANLSEGETLYATGMVKRVVDVHGGKELFRQAPTGLSLGATQKRGMTLALKTPSYRDKMAKDSKSYMSESMFFLRLVLFAQLLCGTYVLHRFFGEVTIARAIDVGYWDTGVDSENHSSTAYYSLTSETSWNETLREDVNKWEARVGDRVWIRHFRRGFMKHGQHATLHKYVVWTLIVVFIFYWVNRRHIKEGK